MFKRAIPFIAVLSISVAALVACNDDTGTGPNNSSGFNPGTPGDGGGSSSGALPDGSTDDSDGGACSNTPAGCFCGTPTTQKEFLNRCTKSAAIKVDLQVKPATTADIP